MAKLKQKDINLLLAMEKSVRGSSVRGRRPLIIIIVAVVVIGIAAVALMYFMKLADLEEAHDEVATYVFNPTTISEYEESQRVKVQAADYQGKADTIRSAYDAIRSYPQLSAEGLNSLYALAGDSVIIKNITFAMEGGSFNMSCNGNSATSAATFVMQLRSSGLFSDVQYNGYSGGTSYVRDASASNAVAGGSGTASATGGLDSNESDDSSVEVVTEYSFEVSCILKPPTQQ